MSRVSYQVAFDRPDAAAPAFEALDPNAIDTRKRDGVVRVPVDLSKRQMRWLRQVDARAGAADASALIRALVDFGMELHIDWRTVRKPADLRAAIRESVLIRRREN